MAKGTTAEEVSGSRKASATIYDIARVTGVSPSTVSRVMSNSGKVKEATEQRVRLAAQDLGYRLNPLARALSTDRTGTIGLVVSDITDAVYVALVRGAQRAATAEGYTVILTESPGSSRLELETANRIQPAVDGIVLVTSTMTDEDVRTLAQGKPLIIVNRAVEGVPSIVPDDSTGIKELLDHLQELGHQSIAYLSGPATSWINRSRWDTLFEQSVARGMSIVEIGPGEPTREGGAKLLPRVLAARATAVVAHNDIMAIGLLMAAQSSDLHPPAEFSIVGFDDTFGALTSPPLTTIQSPLKEIGETAVRVLLSGTTVAEAQKDIDLSTHLVIRESTAPPPRLTH
ncbi:LacI family transcriptional regulator [Arthrobacter sp. Z1-9]